MKNNEISKHGLKLFPVKTKVDRYDEVPVSDYNSFESFLSKNFAQDGYIVAYLDYTVIIRKFKDDKIIFMNGEKPFDPKFIQKLRLFNNNRELFIWRTEGKWKARFRIDDHGAEIKNVIEANQVLFGTTGKVENGFTSLTETRGTEIILSFEIKSVDAEKNRVKIKTRNYIDYNKLGQAGYIDCRFVDFTFGIDNKPIEGN
ncbi:MAG: CRISPR-associated protein Csx19 [Flavobacterium sp.]|nr:CRISPR-associated protein Csx19 [Flavobacterium sp.]